MHKQKHYLSFTFNFWFQQNINLGEIRSVYVLDREEAEMYTLEVEAVDQGVPRLTSSVTVQVNILDENDNAPMVIQPLQKIITVREKQPTGQI